MGKDPGGMPETIHVALVNDYKIVLEGLRAFLRPYEPEILCRGNGCQSRTTASG